MQVQVSQINTGAGDIIKISGALTFSTVTQIWEQSQSLFSRGEKQLNFDLQAVTQSDSAGVALLLVWTRMARAEKKKIVFFALPEQMQAIVKVGGLEGILPIQTTN